MLGRVLILVISMAWLCSPGFAKDVIAVLEPTGPLDRSILMKLSDESRAAAVNTLHKDDYRIITRENMVLILRDMGVDPSCVEGECEVETGRNVGAKYVISGNVIHVRNTWMFTLKLHETDKGALLGTSEARGPDELVLIDKVQEATRALIGRAILGDESAAAVGPTARAPVASHSPSQTYSSVDFGSGGGGLGVAARLREQRCAETAKKEGAKARERRLEQAEASVQSKARIAWSAQSDELEMCTELKRAERGDCIAKVKEWLSKAGAMQVQIDDGFEPVETECGRQNPAFEADSRTVVAWDLEKARELLRRLQAPDPHLSAQEVDVVGKYFMVTPDLVNQEALESVLNTPSTIYGESVPPVPVRPRDPNPKSVSEGDLHQWSIRAGAGLDYGGLGLLGEFRANENWSYCFSFGTLPELFLFSTVGVRLSPRDAGTLYLQGAVGHSTVILDLGQNTSAGYLTVGSASRFKRFALDGGVGLAYLTSGPASVIVPQLSIGAGINF